MQRLLAWQMRNSSKSSPCFLMNDTQKCASSPSLLSFGSLAMSSISKSDTGGGQLSFGTAAQCTTAEGSPRTCT
eukprot:2853243-Prymnesium_polylepis.1